MVGGPSETVKLSCVQKTKAGLMHLAVALLQLSSTAWAVGGIHVLCAPRRILR